MELHFIILIVLTVILIVFIILAICAYCCGDLCYCGGSSYSHHERSFHNERMSTRTASSSRGGYHTEHYSNSVQSLPSSMPLPPPDFETNENYSTPLLVKYPPKPPPLGFGYPLEMEPPQSEVSETSYSNIGFSSPASERTPYPLDPGSTKTSYHVEESSYPYPKTTSAMEINETSHSTVTNSSNFAHKAPLPAKNTPYPSDSQISTTTYLTNIESHPVTSTTPYPSTTGNGYPLEPPRSEVYSKAVETYPSESTGSYTLTKTSQSVAKLPSSYSDAGYHQSQTSTAPYPSARGNVYPSESTKSYTLSSKTSQSVVELPKPYSDVGSTTSYPSPAGNVHPAESTTSYSLTNKTSQSVAEVPTAFSDVDGYLRYQKIQNSITKHPSQVSLYDNNM